MPAQAAKRMELCMLVTELCEVNTQPWQLSSVGEKFSRRIDPFKYLGIELNRTTNAPGSLWRFRCNSHSHELPQG